MTTYVDVIARKDTITIDGYTSNKTERGIIKDVARVVSKYDQSEANTLLDYLKMGLNKYNIDVSIRCYLLGQAIDEALNDFTEEFEKTHEV